MSNELLQRARREGAPVVDGRTVHFVWRGKNAPQLIGDFNDWDTARAAPLTETSPGVWSHQMAFPRDAYLEYAFVRGEKRVSDPLNRRTTSNGMGETNHFFYMPDAAPTSLAQRRRDAPRGEVTRHSVDGEWLTAGKKRTVYLYRPDTPEPCPLVVVLDGVDYLRRARLPHIVDNLIAQKRIRPIALALVANGGSARGVEYVCSDLTVGFLIERVLPLAREQLNLIDVRRRPGVYGILGASAGGLMALYAGLRAPHIFGRVLSQSGGFMLGERELVVSELIRHGSLKPIRVWMDAGRYEWLLKPNRIVHALLVEKGYDVTYHEFNAGHNYPAWRDDVWRGLEHLFGTKS